MTGINKRKPVHFKVHYQLIGKKEKVVRDYLLEDRPELMRMLWKEEGVATTKCEFMVIHMTGHDGTVTEILSYTRPDNLPVEPVVTKEKEVTTVVEEVKKVITNTRTASFGRYTFKEAK